MSIVICSRDRADVLRNCLRSLRDVSYDPLEILIVDNAPTSNATWEVVAEAAKDDPRVDYTCEPRPGLSMARNHGLAKAKFDQVAFTDDDILIDRGWPAAIAAGFASDPKVTCVTGPIAASALESSAQLYFDTRISWSEVFEPRRYDLTQHRHPSPLYPFQAGVLGTGANIAVRRRALDRIGLFDPLLGTGGPGRGGEDLDFLLRVILGGGRVCYLPSAILWHLYRDDAQPLDGQLYSYGHGLGAYLAKHASNKDMRAALVRHGLRQARTVATRMRQASHVSGPQHGGGRLALSEVRGVAMGALHYWQAARRRPNLPQE